jgi:predicted enzyme related to lactoylglutathione lyase
MSDEEFSIGPICWLELPSRHTIDAAAFYAAAFGWRFDENRQLASYVRAWSGLIKTAGFGGPSVVGAYEPAWRPYLAVKDLDRVLEVAVRARARVEVSPVAVGDDGRFALLADPLRTVFGVFEAGSDVGIGAWGGVGCFTALELRTPHPARAAQFYRKLTEAGAMRNEAREPPLTAVVHDAAAKHVGPRWLASVGVADRTEFLRVVQSWGPPVAVLEQDVSGAVFVDAHGATLRADWTTTS